MGILRNYTNNNRRKPYQAYWVHNILSRLSLSSCRNFSSVTPYTNGNIPMTNFPMLAVCRRWTNTKGFALFGTYVETEPENVGCWTFGV